MSHLGSFGAAVKELDPGADRDTFDFFGETFTVHGVIPPMLMLQLGAAATGKIDDQEGLAALWESMRCSLTAPEHEEPDGEGGTKTVAADGAQFDKLYKIAVNRNCSLDDLMKLALALFEVQAGRPTVEPRGSSAGLSTTSPSTSTSSSTHPAFAHLKPVNELLAG